MILPHLNAVSPISLAVKEATPRSVYDTIFEALCAFLGMHCGGWTHKWFRIPIITFWLAVLAATVYIAPYLVSSYNYSPNDPRSLAEISNLTACFVHVLSSTYMLCVFMKNGNGIETLLQKGGRRFRHVIMPLSGILIHFTQNVSRLLVSPVPSISLLIDAVFMSLAAPKAVFLIVYLDVVDNILSRVTRLNRRLQEAETISSELIDEKWNLRDQISETDRFFSLLMLSVHFQNMFSVVFYVVQIAERDTEISETAFQMSTVAAVFVTQFYLAGRSSLLELRNMETGCIMFKRFSQGAFAGVPRDAMLPIFRFREEWDILRSGWFPHNKKNFWKLLSRLVTVSAIVLQFDFKIARFIEELGEYDSRRF